MRQSRPYNYCHIFVSSNDPRGRRNPLAPYSILAPPVCGGFSASPNTATAASISRRWLGSVSFCFFDDFGETIDLRAHGLDTIRANCGRRRTLISLTERDRPLTMPILKAYKLSAVQW